MQSPKELKDLLGEHWLDAVDFSVVQVTEYDERLIDASAIRFRLDGVAYTVVEDPDDGYRTTMGEMFVSDGADMKNVFAPVWVAGRWQEKGEHDDGDPDVIELVDIWTGKVVISVGTDYGDEYYPSFVSYFAPENMVHNLSDTD